MSVRAYSCQREQNFDPTNRRHCDPTHLDDGIDQVDRLEELDALLLGGGGEGNGGLVTGGLVGDEEGGNVKGTSLGGRSGGGSGGSHHGLQSQRGFQSQAGRGQGKVEPSGDGGDTHVGCLER